jgi:hypothetical protein
MVIFGYYAIQGAYDNKQADSDELIH